MSVTVAQSAVWSAPSNASPVFNSTNGWVTPAAGSILLVIINWVSGTPTTPTGWNVGSNTQTPTRSQLVYWMVAAGTESTVTISGSFGAATLIELAGADTTAPIHKIAVAFNAAANPQVTPAVTPTVANTLAIASLWSTTSTNGNASSGAGWTDLPPNTGRGSYYQSVAYSLQDASLAAVSDTFTLVSVVATAGVMTLLLAPAAAPSGTTGTGSATVGAASASGTASNSAAAAGAATAGHASASALASVTSTAAGAATANPATAQGFAGITSSTATGHAVAKAATAQASASVTAIAGGSATASPATAAGVATTTASVSAVGAATVSPARASGQGTNSSTGVVLAFVRPATAHGAGGLPQDVQPNRSIPVAGDVRRGALPAEVRAEAFQPERRTARLTA